MAAALYGCTHLRASFNHAINVEASDHAPACTQDGVKVGAVEGAEPVQRSEKVRQLLGQPLTALPSTPNGAPVTNGAPPNGLPANGGSALSAPAAAAAGASLFTAQAAKDIGGGGGDLTARLERLTRSSPVVLFMKVP